MPIRPIIVIYGALWCEDTTRIAKFLKENKVRYKGIVIEENDQAQKEVLRIIEERKRKWEIPVLILPNREVMINPGRKELLAKLQELAIVN